MNAAPTPFSNSQNLHQYTGIQGDVNLMYELKAFEFQLRRQLPTEKRVRLSGVGASEASLLCDRHPSGSFEVATTHVNFVFI